MADAPPMDQGRPNVPGSLAEVAAEHASRGRARIEDDLTTPEGRAAAAKRQRDRDAYAAKTGRPTKPRVGTVAAASAAELFKPETCRCLVRLPFDIAAARLKSDAWTLDQDEETLLAGPLADSLNQVFPEANPKWAAVSAFALALLTVTTRKYLTWKEEKKNETKPA